MRVLPRVEDPDKTSTRHTEDAGPSRRTASPSPAQVLAPIGLILLIALGLAVAVDFLIEGAHL